MTEPRDTPMGPRDVGALTELDQALDRLAAGLDAPAEGAGEPAALAALAADLRSGVPAPPPGAAERGRAAFLTRAAELQPATPPPAHGVDTTAEAADGGGAGSRQVGLAGRGPWRRRAGGAVPRRWLPLRVVALAAALVVLVAVPAAVARQARPGTALWPLRQVGQQVRVSLADDPVRRAHLKLNTAGSYLVAGAGADEERREDMADRAEEKIKDALDDLDDVAGPLAAAERARAQRLELELEALEHRKDPDDRSGSGPGSEPGDDRSGRGGGDDPADDSSGPGGGGDRSGPGGGSSGSGSSGSRRGGSGDD